MKITDVTVFALAMLATGMTPPARATPTAAPIALVGGTLVDVGDYGRSTHDIPNAVVVVRDGKIESVGTRTAAIPAGTRVVDCTGEFILPGLVDGFAGINSQAQANATLYMGVTTVVGSGDDRRGVLMTDANPSPHVYPIDSAGSTDDYSLLIHLPQWATKLKDGPTSTELVWKDTSAQLEETARRGTRAIWIGHNITAVNVARIVARAHELGLVTYGEFVATPYRAGIQDGVDSLLHMTRYEVGLIPPSLQQPLVDDAEGAALKPVYGFLAKLDPSDPSISEYAKFVKAHDVALVPTFSLEYLELPDHRNLWKEPAAAILDAKGLHLPPDPATGEAIFPSSAVRDRAVAYAAHFWAINRTIAQAHPIYLASSGASAVGTMPGISMHTELELLVRIGLTAREALAAATSNYSARYGWHELGLVAPGRRADLLILDADPTIDIANSRRISNVILDGAIVDRPALLQPK